MEHAQRTRVLLRHGQMVIDDKDSFLARFAPEVICDIAIGRLGSQLRSPRCRKNCAVQLLMTFCAGRNIGPARGTLVVDNLAHGLIENLVAILPDLDPTSSLSSVYHPGVLSLDDKGIEEAVNRVRRMK